MLGYHKGMTYNIIAVDFGLPYSMLNYFSFGFRLIVFFTCDYAIGYI